MENILVVDFGFGFVKSIWKNKTVKIPSLISNYIPSKTSLLTTRELNPIQMNGYTYLFGEDVILNGSKFKIYSREINFIIDFYPLAVKATIDRLNIKEEQIETLVIGLPPEDLTKENAERLKEKIIKAKINNKRFTWDKNQILIFAQGQGAFIDAKKQMNGNLTENGFLLDIGFNTLLAIPYKEGKILPVFKQYNRFGVSGILEDFLSPILEQKYQKKLDRTELEETFRVGHLSLDLGKKINVENDIKYAIELYLQSIQTQIKEDFHKEIPKSKYFILAGGGSYRIKKMLNKNWKNNLIVLEEPEYANARGYLYMASIKKTLN